MKYIKLFEQFDDPFGEEIPINDGTFLYWLKQTYSDQSEWKKMKRAWCWRNNLTSLYGVERLTNLTELSCNDNLLTTLHGIENLKNLKQLYCFRNLLTDLKGIENLTNLVSLLCDQNKLTSIDGLEKLSNLRVLSCPLNNFSDEYKNYLKSYCTKNKINLTI